MENRDAQFLPVMAGAAIGAGFAFLFLTRSGRQFLDRSGPWLEDIISDMQKLRIAAVKLQGIVDEGRRSYKAATNLTSFGTEQGEWVSEARH